MHIQTLVSRVGIRSSRSVLSSSFSDAGCLWARRGWATRLLAAATRVRLAGILCIRTVREVGQQFRWMAHPWFQSSRNWVCAQTTEYKSNAHGPGFAWFLMMFKTALNYSDGYKYAMMTCCLHNQQHGCIWHSCVLLWFNTPDVIAISFVAVYGHWVLAEQP